MRSKWPLVRLGDHVEACLGKMLDAKKNRGTMQPYLGNSNVRWGEFDLVDLAEMRFEPHEDVRYGLLPGDLVICEGGEPGRCAIWNSSVPGMKMQKALHRIRPRSTISNYYLYYWFRHAANNGLLEPHFTGTTIKHLTGKAIAALEVPLPPINTQIQMVDVLRRLDDRIDLLRQTNATLEAIAQALFKSWFVDFDPVRAKMEGREPQGMDAATAALFPDGFEESELGAIPRGWRVEDIGRCVDCVGGGTPSTKESTYWAPAIHCWATPKDLSGLGSPVLLDTERRLSDEGIAKVSSGLLPAGTLIMSSRAPIGYLALAQMPLAVNQGFIAMKPGGMLPPQFLYYWCRLNVGAIKLKANGSTFLEISKAAFRPIRLVLPPQDIVQRFVDFSAAVFDRIAANESQRQGLADLRDALLPRLISGALRVPDAKHLSEVVR